MMSLIKASDMPCDSRCFDTSILYAVGHWARESFRDYKCVSRSTSTSPIFAAEEQEVAAEAIPSFALPQPCLHFPPASS